MDEQAETQKLKKMLEDMYGMKIKDPKPKTEEERAAFWRHFEEVKAEILNEIEAKKKAQGAVEVSEK